MSPYFPLVSGAKWVYQYRFTPGNVDQQRICRIIGQKEFDNKLYYVFENFPGPLMPAGLNQSSERYLRFDPQQNAVFEWYEQLSREQIVIRFANSVTTRQSAYTVQAGEFNNVMVLETNGQARDAGSKQVFAPQLGLIDYSFIIFAGSGRFELIEYSIPSR